MLGLWGMFFSFRYLPIGIASSLRNAAATVFVTLLSYLILRETLSATTIFLIALAIASTVFLGSQKNPMPHLKEKTLIGIVILGLTAFPAAASTFTAAWLSRQVDPFVAGYFWEVSVGAAALIAIALRSLLMKKRLKWIGFRQAGTIALAAWPTLIGTGAFVLAAARGPVAIVATIDLFSVVVSTFIAHLFFQEKLSMKQWMGMGLVVAVLASLRFV